MQQSILFKVPGKPSSSPIVILTGPALGANLSTLLSACLRAARRVVGAVFSARASMAVIGVCLAAMWWHIVTVDDTLAAQTAVGRDCLCALPWAITWAARLTRKPMPEKGGMK